MRRKTMQTSNGYIDDAMGCIPRKRGKLTGQKPPLQPKHVWAIRTRLQISSKTRDLALFNIAIDSKLRGCDVVRLKIEDIAPRGHCVDRATIRQRKTGRPVKFELTEQTRQAIDQHLGNLYPAANGYLFPGHKSRNSHLTTRQYARLMSQWVSNIGLEASIYGTHSLRRTKATLIYRRTGNLRAVRILLGHSKIESTVRYLGVEVEDALAIAEQLDV
jgi:integrase